MASTSTSASMPSAKALGKRRALPETSKPPQQLPVPIAAPSCAPPSDCSQDAVMAAMLQKEADEEARVYWANQAALRKQQEIRPGWGVGSDDLDNLDDCEVEDLFGDDDAYDPENPFAYQTTSDPELIRAQTDHLTTLLQNLRRDGGNTPPMSLSPVHEFHHTTSVTVTCGGGGKRKRAGTIKIDPAEGEADQAEAPLSQGPTETELTEAPGPTPSSTELFCGVELDLEIVPVRPAPCRPSSELPPFAVRARAELDELTELDVD